MTSNHQISRMSRLRLPRLLKTLPGRAWLVSAALLAPLAGPVAATPLPVPSVAEVMSALRPDLERTTDTESLARATKALQLASEMKLPQASKAINEALQLDARNSYLHFFNGLIYHLQARQGDTDKTTTAIEGYQQAIRFDPNNWIAHEFLGLALVEQRQYGRAQRAFAEVLLSKPDDVPALLRMMAASYMAGDAATACTMADRIGDLHSRGASQGASFVRASISVYASCGDFDKATAQRELFKVTASGEQLSWIDQRVGNWRAFHKSRADQPRAPEIVKAQFMAGGQQQFTPDMNGGGGAGLAPQAASSGETRMVLVDVVMVRTEDSVSTSKGVNLLSALSLQFGSTQRDAFSRIYDSANGESSTMLTRAITIPALAYSLNIANANSNLNEVLARPTLAALEGLRSEFFSGTVLNAAVVSGGSGLSGSAVSIEKRYGVKLTVLPQILSNGMIKLSIDASRTFLKPPSSDIGFTYKLEISEILANANVVMRLGDTLILGGLSEKESTTNRDGVPGLQDVPGVQYLFSKQSKTDYQKSVLILITPRPANYTWLSEESKAEIARNPDDPFTPSLDVLRARYSDWFKPYPNLASVFHHLNAADLYREFRTGDVTLESWDRTNSTSSRLRQALGFLYY